MITAVRLIRHPGLNAEARRPWIDNRDVKQGKICEACGFNDAAGSQVHVWQLVIESYASGVLANSIFGLLLF